MRHALRNLCLGAGLVAGCTSDGGGDGTDTDPSSSTGNDSDSSATTVSASSAETSTGNPTSDSSSSQGPTSGTSTDTDADTSAGSSSTGVVDLPPPSEDWTRDILTTDLQLDLGALSGVATITIAGSADSTGAALEIGGLTIDSVTSDLGDVMFDVHDGQLDLGIPSGGDFTFVVSYTFASVDGSFDGWDPTSQVTFLWPYFCGNLFPCKSDPSDGVQFTMNVTGFAGDQTAIYPASIPGDAPSYQPAVAVAAFTELVLDPTTNGTAVSTWYLPGGQADASIGSQHLSAVFDFYEQTYGDYSFGDHVGTVSADWGGGDYGGMEHHPYWHVSSGSMDREDVHAHEAAHGWYGDGVRIACWEDFVLSEGTATYLAARSLAESGVDLWPDYECGLVSVCDGGVNPVVLPDSTCNGIDILNDDLWSYAPYMKGAWFYRGVAELIGEDQLDTALAEFYADHVGQAARMQDMIDHLHDYGDAAAIDDLADAWLRQVECPVDVGSLCAG